MDKNSTKAITRNYCRRAVLSSRAGCRVLGNPKNCIEIVVLRRRISLLDTTPDAAMRDHVAVALLLDGDGLHHSLTVRRPVSWNDIDMPAEQTGWAMVRIPRTYDVAATMLTSEVFDAADEVLHYATVDQGGRARNRAIGVAGKPQRGRVVA